MKTGSCMKLTMKCTNKSFLFFQVILAMIMRNMVLENAFFSQLSEAENNKCMRTCPLNIGVPTVGVNNKNEFIKVALKFNGTKKLIASLTCLQKNGQFSRGLNTL